MTHTIAELHGDGIASELSTVIHTLAQELAIDVEFAGVDLSEAARRTRGDEAVYDEAEAEMRRCRTALKYPTATTTTSPNRELRERCNFAVIHRPVRTIAGIETNFKAQLEIDIVRVATGGTYEDMGRRIGFDTAVSLRVIERVPSRRAGRFAFKLAQLRGCGVVSTSKYTIQKETDGLFEEVVKGVSEDYPATPYRQELFDALLAGVIMRPERYGVIVCTLHELQLNVNHVVSRQMKDVAHLVNRLLARRPSRGMAVAPPPARPEPTVGVIQSPPRAAARPPPRAKRYLSQPRHERLQQPRCERQQ